MPKTINIGFNNNDDILYMIGIYMDEINYIENEEENEEI